MGGGASKTKKQSMDTFYKLGQSIGQGSFATVYEAELIDPDRKTESGFPIPSLVAIKAIDKSKIPNDEIPLLQEEVTIMQKLDHENCVRLLEFFDEENFFYLVLELVKGGEVFDQIVAKNYYNEIEAAHAVRQVARALAYLEDSGIVHRDVKPENLIYESNATDANIKLTDFGLAKDISGYNSNKPLSDPCGTPGYVAPEILCGIKYGCKVDTWALGVILYILLCGYPPFYSEDQQELFRSIKSGKYVFDSPYWDEVSDAAKDVVRKLLVLDQDKRLSAKQVLEEPWVANPDAQRSENFGKHVQEGIAEVQKRKFKRAVLRVKAITQFGKLINAEGGAQNIFAAALAAKNGENGQAAKGAEEKNVEEEESKTARNENLEAEAASKEPTGAANPGADADAEKPLDDKSALGNVTDAEESPREPGDEIKEPDTSSS
ncbi:Protein kinase, putative [Hondaea fermentalgiana]|uniref:Protein kinase, putative n=1 Tax=Hondaea fermentalgiana TaxID=2315210 RepID=A0A2R5G4D3_9STRA|nr:Protein kinase, putative [Hondaea fermentalgiana]|eukprot:GBG24648.1 Protein kinase, putative [Hondaea fermentalgiana]